MVKAEYKEGPQARANFEKLTEAVLRAGNPKKQPKKAANRRKTSGSNVRQEKREAWCPRARERSRRVHVLPLDASWVG